MDKIDKLIADYVGGKEASRILGVHQRTLYSWEKKGIIKTIRMSGGKRLYNVKQYLKDIDEEGKNIDVDNGDNIKLSTNKKQKICYVRVSSNGQKDDMKRQREMMKEKYPKYKIIEDIGSGINFNRKGLNKIIDLAISGKIEELVVAHKDRLARIGYELIERIIEEYSGGKITIIHKNKDDTPEEELVKDVLQIMNVYVAKMNGLRKYKKKKIEN
jgi:predicted site-specific integrase-resolvase